MTDISAVNDRAVLVELVGRLGRWLDDPSAGDVRGFYTEDAEVRTPRASVSGADEVERYLRGDPTSERTQHLATDVVVDLAGDRAEVSANLLNCFFRPGQPLTRMAGLRYSFSAVRTPAGWRFARATVALQWLHPVEAG